MEEISVEGLYRTSNRLVAHTTTDFHRYLYGQISWDAWVIAIKGARGVGKTTMLLQHIKEKFANEPQKALYVSLDNMWFKTHSLTEVIDYHYTHGGTHIFIDEVHKYSNWETLIKNIADEYPEMHVVYTGSSMLKIDNAESDMSRRQLVYTLDGMSFREFLEFEGVASFPKIDLEDLLANHQKYAMDITSKIKVFKHFGNYLTYGYYPMYKRDVLGFDLRLQSVIRTILYEDLPSVEDVTYETIRKTERMLMIMAEHVPQTPNMNDLYGQLETNRIQGLKMLYLLDRAALLSLMTSEKKSMKHLVKPDKIIMNNSNLMYALTTDVKIGTVREVFFYNQLAVLHKVNYPKQGDFLINGKYLFEVGGKKKSFEQIKDMSNSYLAVDDIETGHGCRIPLWMFGMLY